MRQGIAGWARDLPLLWKLLAPFLILLVVIGMAGAFLLVHNLSGQAAQNLDTQLGQEGLSARSFVHDRELYLLESADLAANLEGIAQATAAHDRSRVARLLQSLLALKTDLTLAAVADGRGRGVAQFERTAPGLPAGAAPPRAWTGTAVVTPLLHSPGARTSADLTRSRGRQQLMLATTICAGSRGCKRVGVAVVAVDATDVLAGIREKLGLASGVAMFDRADHLVSADGRVPTTAPGLPAAHPVVRRNSRVGGVSVATLYVPVTLQDRQVGTLGISVPRGPAFNGVRGTALRLSLILLAAMLGIVAIGAALSRFLLGQVRALVATNQALEAGDLSARAPVLGHDELGQLAQGVNAMALALQQSYDDLESRVEERTADVQRLLRERTEFFAAVSHEFRTPLAVILGQAQMVASSTVEKTPDWTAQSAAVLTDAANQLLGFINEILDIASIESGRAQLNATDVCIDGLVDGLRPTIETLASRSGLTAHVEVARPLPVVVADEARLRQALLQLIDNAIKYTPPGGSVTLRAAASKTDVQLQVSDTGVGIPPDAHDRLFEPFYRVAGSETQAGQPANGLGLALVKGLVSAMGGQVSFDSKVGTGTTFTITLPVKNTGRPSVRGRRTA